jgi:beta-phosphoglucomutase-like phosphatase (HAD superfamily)
MSRPLLFETLELDASDVLFCDADGTLFDSEVPAFTASTVVMNRMLRFLGIDRTFSPGGLREWAQGRNFRAAASALMADAEIVMDGAALERWVAAERHAVIEQLVTTLRPAPDVSAVLARLAGRFRLSVVTSSAASRLDACLIATGLDGLLPAHARFSAEDSLTNPISKPDPAIYRFAGRQMDVSAGCGVAVEDSVAGVRSAVGAGLPTVGLLQFVPAEERVARARALRDAGAAAVFPTWPNLARSIAPSTTAQRPTVGRRGTRITLRPSTHRRAPT